MDTLKHMDTIKTQIKTWIVDKKKLPDASVVAHDTALIEQKILKSIDIMDLIMFIEFLRDRPLNAAELKPGAFHSIDSIADHFFVATA